MGAGNGGPVMEVNKAAGRSLRMTAGDIIILTGVSGVGKSTLAARLAADLKAPFIDGDDHHLPASIAKMAQGIALGDADRWPWLEAVAAAANAAAAGSGVVIACSALKRIYRDHLAEGCLTPPIFIHLHAPRHVVAGRLAARAHHFFDASLLDSQMDILEMPGHEEIYRLIDASGDIDSVYRAIRTALS